MQKRAIILFLIIAGLALVFGIFYQNKEPFALTGTGAATNSKDTLTVLANKTWTLSFTKEFNKDSLKKDAIYVTDKNGERVDTALDIADNHVIITPPSGGYSPEKGPFQLHISGDIESIDGRTLGEQKKITFIAKENLPTLQSKEELNELFHAKIKQMKESYEKESIFQFSRSGSETMNSDDAAVGEAESADSSEAMGSGHSETNVQVQGVDEADIVKTDGDFIYQATDQKLKITQASPIDELNVVAEIRYKNFYPSQLFLDGNQLVVIGNFWDEKMAYDGGSTKRGGHFIMPMHDATRAIIYDISNRSEPVVQKTITIEGSYISSRKIDNHVYLIANQYANYWMLEENPEADLRPRTSDTNGDEEEEMQHVPYSDISYFPESTEDNFMTIASFDLNKPADDASILTYLGSGQQIYMSKENLYVAVPNYDYGPHWANNESTDIYKFSVEGLEVEFSSNGSIPGYLLNQFSMDEHNGYFRVAATKGQAWDEQAPSSNHLFILDEALNVVSSVEDLARGERIYSVRFMQDKAYVVTFKEVDPLFVFDLSNPNEPKVLGELKIPGFSNYLHPYDENYLIGFGYDTKLVKDQWGSRVTTNGVKISLFDVTDPTNPLEKHTEIIGGPSTHSPLNYDHKALLFNKEKDIFAFPITMYNENSKDDSYKLEFEGAMVYGIDPEKGFTLHTKLTHQKENTLYEDWENMVQRILYINDHLYTVTPKEVKASRITW
jgi:uncharacterized secreted protein with C-terminal beta-propeller domain